jgi:hypothetical protein
MKAFPAIRIERGSCTAAAYGSRCSVMSRSCCRPGSGIRRFGPGSAAAAGRIALRLPRDIKGGQDAGQGKEMDFDPSAYLLSSLDVDAAGVNPVEHYLLENRSVTA